VKTILHMIETGGTGGAETVYVNLIRGLGVGRWHHLPVLPRKGWIYEQLLGHGMKPLLIAERGTYDVAYFARMIGLIRRSGVDLIHAHLFGSAVRAALLASVCRIPAIATLHGGMDMGPSERFRELKVAALNRGLRRIVFVSEPLRQSFLADSAIRPELATVIPNGIDAARFASGDGAAFRAELGIAKDEFVVGTVASPGRAAKGLDIFLGVAELLKRNSQRTRFVLVGDLQGGRGEEFLRDRAARGLEDDVIVTGFRSDVNRALAAFDVYALTSRSEGFSISLVEAMASGLPVVATRCGGPEQILSDGVTGLLVENESATAIARAIESLRASPANRETLGNAAQKAVGERYTLQAQLKAYERLYEQYLGGGGNPSVPNVATVRG
jgi:glycosyltransferase involved in cell wall biosynthesis